MALTIEYGRASSDKAEIPGVISKEPQNYIHGEAGEATLYPEKQGRPVAEWPPSVVAKMK